MKSIPKEISRPAPSVVFDNNSFVSITKISLELSTRMLLEFSRPSLDMLGSLVELFVELEMNSDTNSRACATVCSNVAFKLTPTPTDMDLPLKYGFTFADKMIPKPSRAEFTDEIASLIVLIRDVGSREGEDDKLGLEDNDGRLDRVGELEMDGEVDGVACGDVLGLSEGRALGLPDGVELGLEEDVSDGINEGKALGLLDGIELGLEEEASEGCMLTRPQSAGLSATSIPSVNFASALLTFATNGSAILSMLTVMERSPNGASITATI